MKKKNIIYFVTFITYFFLSTNLWAAETFTLDPEHTYVLWHIKHLGFSTQAGKWYASGFLLLDKDNPANSKVNATIQVANLMTGLPELDKHLKSKLFFDVIQFPLASFVSNKVTMTSKNTAKIDGILTIHGVSKPIILDAKLNQMGMNPINDKMTAGFSATASVKRSDFGMTTLLPEVGDNVFLTIEVEAFETKKS